MALFGALMFVTDYSMQPVEIARAIEERGLDSLFMPDHSHIPTDSKPYEPRSTEVPKNYFHLHDLFVTLAAAATATKRIKIGTGVCLVMERDPIELAKQVASLDLISNGRVVFGIGGGWNVGEMQNHGTPFKRRWAIVRERILAMKEIWTRDAAEFHGEYVNFDPIWSWPKPVQAGGPPILLGSQASRVFERVAEYCDGWVPICRPNYDFQAGLKSLRAAAERAGRRFDQLELAMFGTPRDADQIKRLLDLGFSHFVTPLPSEKSETVLPILDGYANLAAKLR